MQDVIDIIGRVDAVALSLFVLVWLAFEIISDHTNLRHTSLSGLMAMKRREWMLVLAERDLRMIDTAILAGQQQGAAFFGTAAILAIGGCLAAFGSADVAIQLFRDLPGVAPVNRAVFEFKLAGLTLIFVYAFFKFGWSYRLFNYCSILIGSVQQVAEADSETRRAQAMTAGEMNTIAGRHFTAGLRGIFMALAFLGWFAGAGGLIVMTLAVAGVLIRRQFFSRARAILARESAP
ncbi:MAG: DUF599 family protein [Nitratireductor sp.]|nr:DUF599 family protein [Nitratireductor sp.]